MPHHAILGTSETKQVPRTPEVIQVLRKPRSILAPKAPDVTKATKAPLETLHWTGRLSFHQNPCLLKPQDQREKTKTKENIKKTHTSKKITQKSASKLIIMANPDSAQEHSQQQPRQYGTTRAHQSY